MPASGEIKKRPIKAQKDRARLAASRSSLAPCQFLGALSALPQSAFPYTQYSITPGKLRRDRRKTILYPAFISLRRRVASASIQFVKINRSDFFVTLTEDVFEREGQYTLKQRIIPRPLFGRQSLFRNDGFAAKVFSGRSRKTRAKRGDEFAMRDVHFEVELLLTFDVTLFVFAVVVFLI